MDCRQEAAALTLKLSRRDFLKSTAALPGLLALPAWPVPALQVAADLFALDFIWTCTDPFFENHRDFYLGDGPAVIDELFEAADLTGCLTNRTFGNRMCGKTFLVRAVGAGRPAGFPTTQQDLDCPSLRSKNPLTTFNCPICSTGWWLGRAAKGFERTFFFSALDRAKPVEHFQVSRLILGPPADWIAVKDGRRTWLEGGPAGHQNVQAYEQGRQGWAACNAYLPNKARFTI